ncbi:MAG: ribosome recycling factor [Candidatus Pacebacteria bacterium]|nr:ribosome recycling factor [Candidatus Paceibacterota bacterium]
MDSFDLKDLTRRMEGAAETLRKEFMGLRTGRASVNLLDPVMVDAYGQHMPLNQVGSISVGDARMLVVSVWDKGMVKPVEKALHDANLGVTAQTEGTTIRLRLPELNQERRTELVKLAHKYTEQCRIAVRNIRRDGMDSLKKMEKDSAISQDEHHRFADQVQELTDKFIKKIDESLDHKEKEIMQI